MVARRPAGKVLALVCALLVVPAGCSVLRGTVTTVRALDKAGFRSPQIDPRGADRVVVTVEKDVEDLDAGATEAAEVVWRNLPLPIERLDVTCRNGFGGSGRFGADRAELERRFGARDPDLDRGVRESDLRTVAIVVGGLLVAGLLVAVGIVVLVLVLVRRKRRGRPPTGPGPPGPPGPGGWSPQAPPPGYGP